MQNQVAEKKMRWGVYVVNDFFAEKEFETWDEAMDYYDSLKSSGVDSGRILVRSL